MKQLARIIVIIVGFAIFSPQAKSQCKEYLNLACKPMLRPYLHDGNYISSILAAGDSLEVIKMFYSDQLYRLVVCGFEQAVRLEFKVMDENRHIIFSNREIEFRRFWDFRPSETQRLIIVLKIPELGSSPENKIKACIGVLIGYIEND